jgi:hypothetical protein
VNGKLRTPAALAVPAVLTALALLLLPLSATAMAADGPSVRLSASQAGTGGSITVRGSGWRPHTLLMLLICGQAVPARGVPGGTNSCANADGRAVTTGADGTFRTELPVAEPPVPCPCVVHVATATGAKADADAIFQVAGHPVKPLPAESATGRLSVLTGTGLDGSGGLLTWFGAPPSRTLVLTVGNVGTGTVKNPVFQVGTSHGVFAPDWQDQQWRGTIAPGHKARIRLPVELTAGAHGDYTVSLKYGGKVLAEQPWGVGRPWGVTLFWILLCLVVPAAVFRAGMAVVDRVRPRRAGGLRHRGLHHGGPRLPRPGPRPSRPGPRLPRLTPRSPRLATRLRLRLPGSAARAAEQPPPPSTPTLPWFTPGSAPGTAGRLSAPHDDSPTSRTAPPSRTPPSRKGPT